MPPRGRPFFVQIFLTLLAAMLPLLGLHLYALHQHAEEAEAQAEQLVVSRSVEAAARVRQALLRGEQVLRLLSARDEIRRLDAHGCEGVLQGMAAIDPMYVNIAVASMKGEVLCASVAPERRRPLRFSGARWQAAVAADGLLLSAPVAAGPILGRPVSLLSLPVRNASGQTIGMIGLSFDLLAIGEQLLSPGLPDGGSATLVDATGTLLARHPASAQYIGAQLPHEVRDARDSTPSGVITASGPDGMERLYFSSDVGAHALRVSAGIPSDIVFAEARAAQRRGYTVALLALGVALLVAYHAARWLAAPLNSLTGTARAWAQGRREVRADESLDGEFSALAHEFNAMIEAREESETRLRESERRYAEMLDGVDMLAITLTREGILTYGNGALMRLTGWQHEEVIGQSWARHFLPPDSPQLKRFLHGRVGGDELLPRTEGYIVTRAGERRLIRWAHTPLRDAEGRTIGSSSIGEDITERREVERARQASAEAAAANQAKTEFLSRISHELRTPLNAVLGFSQLLQTAMADRLAPAERHQLEMIFMAGDQLRALIEDILDVSRIEAGHMTVDVSPVDLGAVLEGVMQLSEATAAPAGVRLVAAFAGMPLPTLQTDPVRLRQVLLNLVSNGIKYNRPGGRVTLDVFVQDGRVHVVVADDGLGMTPEQLQTLFEPFNRLGRERTDIAGTGIGMMLSRQLAQLLGGELTVTSSADRGTTVQLVMPLAERAAPAPVPLDASSPPVATAAAALPKGRVLYIEDNAPNAILVQHLLSRWPGVALTVAGDGESGLRDAERLRPDLVLLDMQLPDMDGIRVIERLRENAATRELPVVVLSAGAMPADVERARRAGALDYWTKPIDFLPFLRDMAELLTHRSTVDA